MTPFRTCSVPTPVGDALAVFSDEGLVAFRLSDGDSEWGLEALSHELRALPVPDATAGGELERQLDEYFEGERRAFDVALDWRLVRGFHRDALEAVRGIPYAETASYGEVAILAGRLGAARAVGTACRVTPFSIIVPVHRVIRSDGSLGEYGARPELKRRLIELERDHSLTTTEGLLR